MAGFPIDTKMTLIAGRKADNSGQGTARQHGLGTRKEIELEFLLRLLLVLAFSIASIATSSAAGERAPLFVYMTTGEADRANMRISFDKKQLELGHPLRYQVALLSNVTIVEAKTGGH
jgi:hypothetical protein